MVSVSIGHPGVTSAQLPRRRRDRYKSDTTEPRTVAEVVTEGFAGGIVNTGIGV